MQTRRSLIVAMAIAVAISMSGCGVSTTPDPGGDVAGPIKIGAAISETGKFAVEGVKTKHGYEIWADMVNARGGLDVGGTQREVEIIYYDDQSEPETAIKLTQRLISEDEVDFLFGPYSSGLTIATSAIAKKYKKLMFAGAATAVSAFSNGNEYLFGPMSLGRSYTTAILDVLKDKGVDTIGILHSTEAPMIDIKDATVAYAEKLGIEVVSVQSTPADATDITGALRQIQKEDPDVFLEAGTTVLGFLTVRTMRDIGWVPEYPILVQAPTEAAFIEELGADTVQGLMAPTQWMPNDGFKDEYFGTAQDYFDAYVDRYGEVPGYLPPSASAAGLSLQLAIQQAGSLEVEKVRQALVDMNVDTFFGHIDYSAPDDPSGLVGANVDRSSLTIQLTPEGEAVVVAPSDAAQSDVVPFLPWSDR